MKHRIILSLFVIASLVALFTACSGRGDRESSQPAADAKSSAPPGAAQPNQAAPVASNGGSQPSPTPAVLPPPSLKVAEVIKPEPGKPGKKPKIVLASTKLDFGKQAQSKTINRSIVVRNGGNADLEIESVTPSCGCTTVDFPKVVKAGSSGRISIKVETGTSPGPHTKQVTIKSNDPEQPTVIVQFSLDVKG
jgi:hypothetical protein